MSDDGSYPTITKVKKKLLWKCCYKDIDCIYDWLPTLPGPDVLNHFVTITCPSCKHYSGEYDTSPTKINEVSPKEGQYMNHSLTRTMTLSHESF